jgi:hypothetical protein
MKRNIKGELGAVTVVLLSGFLLVKHTSLGAMLPFKLTPNSAAQQIDYQPIGRMVLEGDYDLSQDLMLHTDKTNGDVQEFTLNKKGKPIYKELIATSETCRPISLPGTAGSGYLKDVTGDTEPDFIMEQLERNAGGTSNNRYTYTVYSLNDTGVTRYQPEHFEQPVQFKDFDKDGVAEAVCKDTTLVDFGNNKHSGQMHEVICSWTGTAWDFSAGLMKQKPLSADALKKVTADLDSMLLRYDTTDDKGTAGKRIELHANAVALIADMIYHGNAAQANVILKRVWADNETAMLDDGSTTPVSRQEFWKNLWSRLDAGPFGNALNNLNAVER